MKPILLAALSATAILAACGKPAEVQPEPQIAGQGTPAAPAGAAPEAPAPTTPVAAPAGPIGADLPPDQTSAEQRAEQEKAASAAGLPATKQTRTSFRCDNGETIEVRFFPDQGVAVLVRGGQNTELNGEPAASGFRYSNGQTTIIGKGEELKLTVGMMAPTTCNAEGV